MTIYPKWSKGFTLSEILVALAILGICLAVSIPMMAQSRDQAARKAILKEAYLTVSDIMRQGMANDDLYPINQTQYYFSRINANKYCWGPANGAENCWDSSVQGTPVEATEPGLVLSNGAQIVGFNVCCQFMPGQYTQAMIIDWNGKKPPNALEQDQLELVLCYSELNCQCAGPSCSGADYFPVRAGTISSRLSPNLFREVMK